MARRVYLGLRAGSLDPQDVVGLACEPLDWFHCADAFLEVVERNPAEVPRAEMTALAWRALDNVGFDPGFDLGPRACGRRCAPCCGSSLAICPHSGHILAPVGELAHALGRLPR
ncbi:hypothetical protein OHS59_01045 [Streptomyces sp. NBC_00414]|uniref:hypothetical protein n=1 Tax=Streptomyces sp. NBC_00414 TaxID=2975739 RepID=UPI002E1A0F1B